MRALGWFIGACFALALLRAAINVALVALALGLLVALVLAPARTLITLLGLLVLGAMASHPGLGLLFLTALVLAPRAMPKS